jgi:hypothetical protein
MKRGEEGISCHKYNLKPTLADYIYHKNEIGKLPKKGFVPNEKLYHNFFGNDSTVQNSWNFV